MAIEHGFRSGTLPPLIAVDADFVVSVLVETEQFHRQCVSFSKRLATHKVQLVSSPVLRLEFLQAWRKALNRRAVPPSFVQQVRLWDDSAEERAAFFERGEHLLDDFIDSFDVVELPLGRILQRETRIQMAQYNLSSMDACLLATALRAGTDHIVSLDSDFRRVDGIHLWNDNIPAKRQAARRRKRA